MAAFLFRIPDHVLAKLPHADDDRNVWQRVAPPDDSGYTLDAQVVTKGHVRIDVTECEGHEEEVKRYLVAVLFPDPYREDVEKRAAAAERLLARMVRAVRNKRDKQ